MIAPETVAEIRRLFYAEHWKVGTIATALELHPETVKNALHLTLPAARTPPPRVTDSYAEFIRATLQQYPRLRVTRLLEMLRDRGFTGSIHQLRRAVKPLRPATREAFFRLTTLPGEQAQVDWASTARTARPVGRTRAPRTGRPRPAQPATPADTSAPWTLSSHRRF